MKPEPVVHGDRRVYTVSGFNMGVASWIGRLPEVWVEGEITELTRQAGRPFVFFTLKDPGAGATVPATMDRAAFDALELAVTEGAQVHVQGRPELWPRRGMFRLRARAIEPYGLGEVLARIEALRRRLAAEGLFAPGRKRRLPFIPRLIGLVTGREAAARHDVIETIRDRFPPARILVAETYVQGPKAPAAIAATIRLVCRAGADVIVLARGGGSFEDLLPFSDERLIRAIAACPVPVVTAVGHEQDVPLCDLAADVRAATPTAAARLVVPDYAELVSGLDRDRERLQRAASHLTERRRSELEQARSRLRAAPSLLVERKTSLIARDEDRFRRAGELLLERGRGRIDTLGGKLSTLSPAATLARGYSIVRREGTIVRAAAQLAVGDRVDVELAAGTFGATVDEPRP